MTLPPLRGGSQRLYRAALLPLPAGRSVVLSLWGLNAAPYTPCCPPTMSVVFLKPFWVLSRPFYECPPSPSGDTF